MDLGGTKDWNYCVGPAFKDKDKEKDKDKVKEKGERQIQILEAGVTKDRNYSVAFTKKVHFACAKWFIVVIAWYFPSKPK